MKDLINRYMNEISPTKAEATHRTNLSAAKFLILSLGDFKPRDVKAVHVYQHLDARKDAPIRANREVSLLSSIFTAAKRWGVVFESPVREVERFTEKPRTRLVTDAEIEAFKKYAPAWMHTYIDLKLITALRQTDMLRLHSKMWADGGLWVQTSKTGRKLCFNADENLKQIYQRLQEQRYTKDDNKVTSLRWWFFSTREGTPYTPDGFRSIWHRAMKKALASGDLTERFQEKDLRARAATDCSSIIEAFELCGHTSLSTTKRIYRRGFTRVNPVNTANRLKKN